MNKPFSDYNRDPKGKFGLAASCRECKNGLRRKTRFHKIIKPEEIPNPGTGVMLPKGFHVKPIAEEINDELDKLYQEGVDKLSVSLVAEEVKHTGEFKECDLCQEYKQRLAKPDIFSLIPKILTKGHFSISFFPNGKINLRIHESKERNFHGKDLSQILKEASR